MSASRFKAYLIATCVLSGAPGSGIAQTSGEAATDIIVTGDRIADAAVAANRARRDAPNPVTVIAAAQLNQFGDQPLGDALRRVAGISFPGANRARDIQLRGLGVEYTQVLLNGRPLIDGNSKRSVQVDRIPSSLVARVEIIRSPLASLDGQGASGTVDIVLKNRLADRALEVGIGGGYLTDNGWLGDATLAWRDRSGPLAMSLLGGIQRQRRNESRAGLVFTSADVANGGTIEQNERRYDQINILPAFVLDVDDANRLRFEPSYLHTREDRNDIQTELLANQASIRRREVEKRARVRENYGLFGAWDHQLNEAVSLTASIDYQRANEDTTRDATRYTAAGAVDRTRYRTEDVSLERVNPALTLDVAAGAHALRFGADYSRSTRDETNSATQNGVVQAPTASRIFEIAEKRANGFVQDIWQLSDAARLTLGARIEKSLTRTRDAAGQNTAIDRTYVLPSAHLILHPDENLDVRVSVARTLRRPDLRELSPTIVTAGGTVANPDTAGNPNTTPEQVTGIDLSVDRATAGNRGLLSASVFYRWFDDKIEAVTALENGRYVQRASNSGNGRAWGTQLDGRAPLDSMGLPTVALWGNATWTKTRLKTVNSAVARRFADQPDAVANIGIDANIPALRTTLGLSSNWNSGYRQNIVAASGTALRSDVRPSTRIDASLRTDLASNLSLSLSALNLLARTERRNDTALTTAGTINAITRTGEPTYRTFYARVQARF
jgi:iron complex outermembrane receptor protein